ncbi:MAG: hypothetical protein ACREX8_14730, partial [Gammaproteobacteria bacterium]
PKGMSAQDDKIVFNSDLSAPTRTPWPTQARRRLRVHGVRYEPLTVNDDGTWAVTRPAVHLAQYPSPGRPTMSAAEILSALDNLVPARARGRRTLSGPARPPASTR